MWCGALHSSDLLLSYPVTSLASHITIILIFTLKHTYIYQPTVLPGGLPGERGGAEQGLVHAVPDHGQVL